jgi:hypothetical protein
VASLENYVTRIELQLCYILPHWNVVERAEKHGKNKIFIAYFNFMLSLAVQAHSFHNYAQAKMAEMRSA